MTIENDNNIACPSVLFLIFNRHDTTIKVFDAIRLARPKRLYIASDGARENRVGEREIVDEVRAIVSHIDWPCQVFKLYRDSNLGCKRAVSSAIDWFFEHEEEGVILEDDCLPHIDFFQYCAQLLNFYRDDERIGFISGTSLCDLRSNDLTWNDEDYVFTRYPSVWGWATWRRVWKDYDVSISSWSARRNDVATLATNPKMSSINAAIFDRVFVGEIDTWDYQVSYLLWTTGRLAIAPRFNLIENIGFGPQATHTTVVGHALSRMSKMHHDRLIGNLRAPNLVMRNIKYQNFIEKFSSRPLFLRVLARLRLVISQTIENFNQR